MKVELEDMNISIDNWSKEKVYNLLLVHAWKTFLVSLN